MLLVKTYIDKSNIQGIGLFAGEDIAEGTAIWRFVEGFDFVISKSNFQDLPEITKEWILTYAYFNTKEGGYVICTDNGRFANHSLNNNITDCFDLSIAKRNIYKGEELTCNYFDFDETAKDKLL